MRKKQKLLILLKLGFAAILLFVISQKNDFTAYADSIKDPTEFEGDVPLSPGDTVTVHVDKGETKYIRFACEASGYYLFTSSSDKDTYGEAFGIPKSEYKGNAIEKNEYEHIYNDTSSDRDYRFDFNDDSGENGQFAIRYKYRYHEEINDYLLIAVSFYDNENESGDISVSCKKITEPEKDDTYNIKNHEYSFSSKYVGIKDLKTSDFFTIDDENVTYDVHFYASIYFDDDYIRRYQKEIPTETDDYLVCIKGTGDYYGTITNKVVFVGGNLKQAEIGREYSGTYIYDGQTPDLNACFKAYYDLDNHYFLKYGVDYNAVAYAEYINIDSWKNRANLEYKDGIPSEIGKYVIKFEGIGSFYGNNYNTVNILDDKSINLCRFENAAIENEADYKSAKLISTGNYCGGGKKEEVLVYGKDYYISKYRTPEGEGEWIDGAPTRIGSYYVTIVGMGDYHGESEVSLRIIKPYYSVTVDYNIPEEYKDKLDLESYTLRVTVDTQIKELGNTDDIEDQEYDEENNEYKYILRHKFGGWKIEGMGDTIYSTKAINETVLTKNIKIIAQWDVDYTSDDPADLGNNNPDKYKPTPTPAVSTPTPGTPTPTKVPTDGNKTDSTTAPTDGGVSKPTATPSVTPSAVPTPVAVKDKTTTFSIKNKATVKKTAKIKIKDKDKIKKITLNGKNVKIKKKKTSVTIKLKSYKKTLKKKGKWNKLVVIDVNGNTRSIKFKTK